MIVVASSLVSPPYMSEYPLGVDFETHESGELSVYDENRRMIAVHAAGTWASVAEGSVEHRITEVRS